jgi:hypothetical protein
MQGLTEFDYYKVRFGKVYEWKCGEVTNPLVNHKAVDHNFCYFCAASARDLVLLR